MKGKLGQSMLMAAPAAIVMLVVIAVVLGVSQNILTKVGETQTTNSYAYNTTVEGEKGIDTFSDFQTTLATIVVAVVIIGMLLGGFGLIASRNNNQNKEE